MRLLWKSSNIFLCVFKLGKERKNRVKERQEALPTEKKEVRLWNSG